jgi:hypothetical protein
MVPAASRLPEAVGLVEQEAFFVVHAPRQTGKTTTLQALAAELTGSGRYAALYFSCEVGGAARDDYDAAVQGILERMTDAAQGALPAELRPPAWPERSGATRLARSLSAWAEVCPRPLVLFFDEIDALTGQSLISVLRQLRDGYILRSTTAFPSSVVLSGLRNVRDYKTASGGSPETLGSPSPCNIQVESLRLGDFTRDEVRELYSQHTADTGQRFTPEAVDHAFALTRGQPRLVNALAREIVEKIAVPVDETITVEHVDAAKERLIVTADPRAYVLPDDRFDLRGMLASFAALWVEHGRALAAKQQNYREIAPHIVPVGFLQRVVNGGGYVDREYGIATGRIDILLRWPYTDANGKDQTQREAFELKVWRSGESNPLKAALRQLDLYLDGLTLDTGVLIIFHDRKKKIARPAISTVTSPTGRGVTLLRC